MKNSVEIVKGQVMESLGSLFTKEDVIKVIDSIEVGGAMSPNEDIEERLESIMNSIESLESEVEDLNVETDNVEFGLDGNRLYIEEIEMDKSSIESAIRDLRYEIEELKKLFVVVS